MVKERANKEGYIRTSKDGASRIMGQEASRRKDREEPIVEAGRGARPFKVGETIPLALHPIMQAVGLLATIKRYIPCP